MDNDQTYNSIVFVKSLSDSASVSKRQSIARGINTPDIMTIQSQAYVDSVTKVAGRRYNCKLTRVETDANAVNVNITAGITFQIPSTASTAGVTALVATLRAVVADADHMEDVLNNEA
jgi:hypothetical protein